MSLCLRVALIASALILAPAAQAAVLITVDKSTQQMTVAVDGTPLYQWPVSTGAAGYDTPSGKFRAFRMERDHFSKEFDDAPMPFSIFFTERGHAIHGSYDRRLGRAVSHGCVRLAPANAEKLYALVEEQGVTNTTVDVTGTIPSRAPAVARRTLPRPATGEYDVQPDDQQAYQQPYQEPYQPPYQQPYGGRYYVAPAQPYPYYAPPRGYVYGDPYGAPAYPPRYPGSIYEED